MTEDPDGRKVRIPRVGNVHQTCSQSAALTSYRNSRAWTGVVAVGTAPGSPEPAGRSADHTDGGTYRAAGVTRLRWRDRGMGVSGDDTGWLWRHDSPWHINR
jgi:hypothetical protein